MGSKMILKLRSKLGMFLFISGLGSIFTSETEKAIESNCKQIRQYFTKYVKDRRSGKIVSDNDNFDVVGILLTSDA